MTSRRPRSAAIALLFALLPGLAAALDPELQLKLEKQMRLAPARPERDSAKFLEADHIEGQPDKTVVATGNVTIRQRGATIRADRLEYSAPDQVATATGSVTLERGGDKAVGPKLRYDLSNDTGVMDSPVFEFPKTGDRRTASRGHAEKAILHENRVSNLERAEYTSCPAPRDDWFIRVREMRLDGLENMGTAYDTTVYFLGLPLLYSPYLHFPLDNQRKSGFLAPTIGTSGQSGFEMGVPYYWNIAPNRDATVTPKIYTKRGFQLGGEFRYLGETYKGQLDSEYLPNDRIKESDRWFVGVRHEQALWAGWRAAVVGQQVSDDDYFRDLSTKIAATSQTNLPRDAILAYDDDTWSFSARALAYQTLQDPNGAPVPIPYRIVPRISLAGARQGQYGFDWNLLGELSNFRHPTLVNGQRAILYPTVSYPVRSSYGYVVPRVGYYALSYNLGENAQSADDKPSLALPVSSVDAGLYFDRRTQWLGYTFEQTLEPRLYYLYVPYKDQSQLPNFTTAVRDFNFAQIFTDNRFVGGDRVGDANQLTFALATRLIDADTGVERFRAALGQIHYFKPPRVTLGEPATEAKSSDIVAFASSRLSNEVAADVGVQYTPSVSRSQRFAAGTSYSPAPGRVINAAYRYARASVDATDPSAQTGIEQVDLSSQWPITRNLSGLARWNWSVQDRKLLEGLVGVEYNAGCWQVRAVAHRFITATQQYSTSFQLQLELSGLSRIGINPLETLRQNIAGYRRSDEIPQE